MKVVASAPAKVILFGEHSVVYGYPAIATAINLRAHVTAAFNESKDLEVISKNYNVKESIPIEKLSDLERMNLKFLSVYTAIKKTIEELALPLENGISIIIDSEIPPSAGLGSSAAVSVATVYALSHLFNKNISLEKVSAIAYEAEKVVHGTPSGIDNTISTFGGMIYYKKGISLKRIVSDIEIPLVIGNTGIPRSTKDLVMKVRTLREKYPELIDSIFEAMGQIAELALDRIANKDILGIGQLMIINQGLLESLGVSHIKLSLFIHEALANGALGAKLTGAGGGGCMIAIVEKEFQKRVANAIRNVGGKPIITSTSNLGVSVSRLDE